MIFSSSEFFVFLLLVLGLIGVARSENQRRNILLAASYFFYGWWDWRFCFLMFTTTTIDYLVGLQLERMPDSPKRRNLLVLSLAANLSILFYFKYSNFFIDSLNPALAAVGVHIPHLEVILPAGISFFTFQSMSYTIDVYWRKLPATRSFRDFTMFVSFFPQLVAGPIVRGSVFLPQLKHHQHTLKLENLRRGAEIFLRGFVKKVVFADTLAQFADPVFQHPAAFDSATVWLGVLAYTGQIYYDFSGYTDMAIGCGRMFGFEFPVNFRHPYCSRSITEFWRRWHITLSTWLRDYVYIPLGGNRRGRARTYWNLAATMLLGGLWHGANWTFVTWGALHGLALMVDKFRMDRSGRGPDDHGGPLEQALGWAGTFLFVIVGWVFFRARNFHDAGIVLRKMAGIGPSGIHWVYVNGTVVLVLGVLFHVWFAARGEKRGELRIDLGDPLGWTAAALAVMFALMFSSLNANPFIYFQF